MPDAGERVLAAMAFPDDAEARAGWMAGLAHAAATRNHARAPARHKRLSKALFGMTVAGDLLILIRALALAGKPASLEVAARLWARSRALDKKFGGRPVPASRRAIMYAWSRFKPSAPLCAAGRFLMLADGKGKTLPEQFALFLNAFLDPARLPSTLLLAEYFREFGERHHPLVGRTRTGAALRPVLDPATCWRPPGDLSLPLEVGGNGQPPTRIEDLLALGIFPADEL